MSPVGSRLRHGDTTRRPAREPPPGRSCRARSLPGSACTDSRRQPADDQLDRDRPVLPVDPPGLSPCPRAGGSHRRTLLARRRNLMDRLVPRDEREASIDHAADRLSYLVLSFGLLAIVAYRSLVDRQTSWDLLGLVVLGGLVGTGYRVRRRVVSRRWELVVLGTAAMALVVAAIIAFAARA